jgi:hypothetical protein
MKIFLILCVHFTQLVDDCVTWGFILHNIIKHTHAKISVSTLECQISFGDTSGEVVDR